MSTLSLKESQVEELLAKLPNDAAHKIGESIERVRKESSTASDNYNGMLDGVLLALNTRTEAAGKKRNTTTEEDPPTKKTRTTPMRYTEWMLCCKAVAALPQCTVKQIPGRFNTAFKPVYNDNKFAEAIANLYMRTEEKFKPAEAAVLSKDHLPVDLEEWVSELYQDKALQPFFDAACVAVMAEPEDKTEPEDKDAE
jgi:hypothetical protein